MARKYKRKQYKRRALFSRSQMKAIRKIAAMSGELKTTNATAANSGIVSGSGQNMYVSTANIPAQGDGDDQRVGDQIRLKEVAFRSQVATGTANGSVRCYVIQHLDDAVATVNNLDPNDFFPNLQASGTKYKVLYDRLIALDPGHKEDHVFDVRIPASKLRIKKLNMDTGATTLQGGGDISFHLTTNNTAATQITTDTNCRVKYYDS